MVYTAASLIVLSVFRRIESRTRSEFYAHFHVRFRRAGDLCQLVGQHGFTVTNMHARLIDVGGLFECRMVIKSRDRAGAQALWKDLLGRREVVEFRISLTGD